MTPYAIVADIGGTFARFCRIHLDHLVMDKIAIYPCAEFESLDAVFLAYQKEQALEDIKLAAFAIACPVLGDCVSMTNCSWHFSVQALKESLQLEQLQVINDFIAIAMSLPSLAKHQVHQVGQGQVEDRKIKVVLGAGTGLGLAYLVPSRQGHVAYAGEGGHASWGAQTAQEWFIYNALKQHYGHVSCERVLSGHGLEDLYQALAAFHQKDQQPLTAAGIIAKALAQEDDIAQEAVLQFFKSLGTYAGDMALTFSAFGGLYIAGGIVPRLLSLIDASDFRANFEAKGRFREFNAKIPTYVITEPQPGLLGAALFLKQALIGERDVIS